MYCSCVSIVLSYEFSIFLFFIVRDKLKDLSKEYDKSENDLKALQSVGQVIIQDVYRVAQNFCGSFLFCRLVIFVFCQN